MVIGGRGLPGGGDSLNGEEADNRAPHGYGQEQERARQGQSEYHQEQGDKVRGKKGNRSLENC